MRSLPFLRVIALLLVPCLVADPMTGWIGIVLGFVMTIWSYILDKKGERSPPAAVRPGSPQAREALSEVERAAAPEHHHALERAA
jgi:hypothetical protein